jgi:hypothetical protein
MAVDRSRLAAALAYRQAEEERRRRMMESVPVPGAELPTPVPSQNLRRDLENLSIGIGEGLTNQLEGVKGLVTDPVGTVKGAYEGVKGIVRDPSVLADALRYTADKAMSGPLGAGEVIGEMVGPMRGKPVMAEIDVYHGSPHVFDEFDASKIGTGEGAQAYGHGIYLAESPNVAQHYSTGGGGFVPVQGKDNVYFNGQWVQDFSDKKSPEGLAKYAMSQSSTGTTIKEKTETLSKIGRKDAADWLEKNADKFNQSKGNLYTADLPDEMVDRMLDWDKPLSEQPAAVRNAFNDLLDETGNYQSSGIGGTGNLSGSDAADLYNDLKGMWNENYGPDDLVNIDAPSASAAVSEFLRRRGILGIKYADAGSRGQGGSGTRNFVVFPGEEKKVRILERK